jgi:hypothetical protein
MARSFVIVYSGREGSSAIIKAFADQQAVKVPIVEDFDQYACPGVDENDVPALLLQLLTTGQFRRRLDRDADVRSRPAPARPTPVAFKWRIWGDAREIAKVLNACDVVIFELIRRDIVNLALSLYLTTYVLPFERRVDFDEILQDPNPQFRIRWLEKKAQDEVISFVRSRRFAVQPDKLAAIMADYLTRKERIREQYVATFRAGALDVHTLIYEDFLADPVSFLSRMATLVGVSIDPLRQPYYPKVSRSDIRTQVTNLAALLSDREVQRLKLAYHSRLLVNPRSAGADRPSRQTLPGIANAAAGAGLPTADGRAMAAVPAGLDGHRRSDDRGL